MRAKPHVTYASLLRRLPHLSIWAALIIGILGLLGWALDIEWMHRGLPSAPRIRHGGALGIVGLAAGLACVRPRAGISALRVWAGRALSIAVGLLGAASLSAAACDVAERAGLKTPFERFVRSAPARYLPVPLVALCFILLALSLLLHKPTGNGRGKVSHTLAAATLALTMLVLAAYSTGATSFYPSFVLSICGGMSLNAALGLFAIALGILASRPDLAFMRLLGSNTSGGLLARRAAGTIVAGVLGGSVLGFLGHKSGLISDHLHLAISLFVSMAAFLVLAWLTARRIDTTDRLRAEIEEKLIRNEGRLNAILQALPVAVWWTDEQGTIIQGNPAGHKIWAGLRNVGPSRYGEYKGFWADSGTRIEAEEWALARALSKGESSFDERIKIQCFDGTWKMILNSAMPIRTRSGKIAGAIAVNVDITEKDRLVRRQELLAKAGRELLNSLNYDDTLARVASIAVPTLGDCCTVYALDESGEISVRTMVYRDSPLAEKAKQIFHAWHPSALVHDGVFDCMRRCEAILFNDVTREQFVAYGRDEQEIEVLKEIARCFLVVPLTLRGRVIGALALVRGESGRRFAPRHVDVAQELANMAAMALENARLYKQAQQSIKAREEVVAIVSHDLRNPLAAIRLNASLLCATFADKGKTAEEIVARAEKASAAIVRSSDRMTRLLNDLLILAKIEAGRLHIEKVATKVPHLLNDLLETFQHAAAEKGLTLHIDAPEALPDIEIDRERMLQALANLVGNAIKFTPAGGAILVGAALSGGEVTITVSDNGAGIAPAHLPHIFDRYWQPKETAKKGSGLGLFIAKGIIEAHGGCIRAESTEGRGAVFHVSLPARQ